MAKLTVAFVRDVMNQHLREEVSFSRMVEIFHDEVERKEKYSASKIFAREECIYNYCPHPNLCKDVCQCPNGENTSIREM